MEQHIVGTITEVNPINTKTGKVMYGVTLQLRDGSTLKATTWDVAYMKPGMVGSVIETTMTQNGQYNNLGKNWSFVHQNTGGASAAQQAAHVLSQPPAPSFASTPAAPTSRDDQIVRQSAMYQAINLYPHLVAQGAVPWPKTGKGKNAAEDHNVVLEFVFEIASRIHNRVLKEDWATAVVAEAANTPADYEPSNDDIPF